MDRDLEMLMLKTYLQKIRKRCSTILLENTVSFPKRWYFLTFPSTDFNVRSQHTVLKACFDHPQQVSISCLENLSHSLTLPAGIKIFLCPTPHEEFLGDKEWIIISSTIIVSYWITSMKGLLWEKEGRPLLLSPYSTQCSLISLHWAQSIEIVFTSHLFWGLSPQGPKLGFINHVCFLLEIHSLE